MASSAINTQSWNAKAANVQNQNGSPIYAGGVWSLLNSSGTTTFSVSDAGVVTTNYNGTPTTATTVAGFGYAGTTRMQIKMNNSTGVIVYNNNAGFASQWTVNDVLMGQMDSTGAWTLGPASGFTGTHAVRASGTNATFQVTNTAEKTRLYVMAPNIAAKDAELYLECSGSNAGGLTYNRATSRLYAWAETLLSGPYVASNGTSWTTNSDARLKTNIAPISAGLAEVMQLAPSKYEYINNPGKQCLGLIAQDVLPIIPEIVDVPSDSELMMGIDYTSLVPILVKAIQEQQAQIDALRLLIKGA